MQMQRILPVGQLLRNAQLLVTRGLDKKLKIFQIDGKRNSKIQSIFIYDCPVQKVAFLPNGSQVIVSERRKLFYGFDLIKAKMNTIGLLIEGKTSLEAFEVSPDSNTIAFIRKEGYKMLVLAKTKELVGALKMNGTGTVRSLPFSKGRQQLLSPGGDGQNYHWDLRARACFHMGANEGCVESSSLCMPQVLFAAVSDSGMVNIYNQEDFYGVRENLSKPYRIWQQKLTL